MTFRLALLSLIAFPLLIGCGEPAPKTETVAETPAASPAVDKPRSPKREDANRIAWKTASEVDNFGYDIYRSESPDGPFVRITEQPLEGAGTTDLASTYEFFDETIDFDKEYFYYVESISMNGERQPFTPVSRAAPKPAPSPEEEPEEG